jgi:hypothetical protein
VEGQVHIGVGVEVQGQTNPFRRRGGVHLVVRFEVQTRPFRRRGGGGGTDKFI